MRAQFLMSSKIFFNELKKNRATARRQRASFFVIALFLLAQSFLASFTPLYVQHVSAKEKTVLPLETQEQKQVKLEAGASGKPLNTQRTATNDPSTFKASVFEEKELQNERG